MEFKLVIECDNDAFAHSPLREVQRILKDVRRRIESEEINEGSGRHVLMDANGNSVGSVEFVE